jgi:hypothetical protein
MKLWAGAVLAVVILLGSVLSSEAGGRDFHGHPGVHGQFHGGPRHFHAGGPRVFIGVGPVWPSPWWYYPQPYYVYAPPTLVVVQAPPVYVEAAPVPPPPQQYWYLCQSFHAYYPQVQTCPEPWLTVPARAY